MDARSSLIACSLAAATIAGCTPGAATSPDSNRAALGNAVVIGMSLLRYGQSASPFGTVEAYNPGFVTVALGASIQFHNEDGFNHTATMISGSFPSSNKFSTSALGASGSALASANWSTGRLDANGFSQPLRASATGAYLYGCYFHYPSMRGVIIVQ